MTLRIAMSLAVALGACGQAQAAITLQRTYDGPAPGGEFGFACAIVGDMDGDGFAEFAIGAPADPAGGEQAGRVFIFRGGDPLPSAAAWVITGEPGERLGHSLGTGFVDGDFVPVLVIGAPGTLPGQPGRVVIAYGGNPVGARQLRSVAGLAAGDRFGWSVAPLAWFGPSLAVVVGAPEAHGGAGEVHGLGPGDPPPAARAFVLHGAAKERFGYSVADAGITRGTIGGPEFLVGAPEFGDGAPQMGRFAHYILDAPGDTLPVLNVHGATAGERTGHSVAGGEDTNPNFFEPMHEIVAGAPGASSGGSGRAEVRSDQLATFELEGAEAGAAFGSTVRLFGNVTGSWVGDLAVAQAGAVLVFAGPLQPSSQPAAVLTAETPDGRFGHAISNDGWIDPGIGAHGQFLVGAPDHAGAGRVYLYADPSPITGVGNPLVPATLQLGPPAPNPASAGVAFEVTLPRGADARIAVCDLAGRVVALVHDGPLAAGRSVLGWDVRRAGAPGLYFVTLEAEGTRLSRRLAVTR